MGLAEFEEAWRRRRGGRIQEQRRDVELVVLPEPEHQAQARAIQAGAPAAGRPHGDRLAAHERTHGDLVAAQLASPADRWPHDLSLFVAGVTVADFVLDQRPMDSSLDVCLTAVRT